MDTKINLEVVAQRFQAIRTKDGKPAFESFEFENYLSVLESACPAQDQIVPHDWRRILHQSIFDAAENTNPLTERSIKGAIGKLKNSYLQLPAEDYVILTSLSIDSTTVRPVSVSSGVCELLRRAHAEEVRPHFG